MARNKFPEETRNLILDTAQKLFLEKGYENTSIQDIINGLGGLSKGAIYHHFKNKDDIFYAVVERTSTGVIGIMSAIRDDKSLNATQKLKKMFEVSLGKSEKDDVISIAPNFLENPKLLAQQLAEIFEIAPNFVQPIVEEGIAEGSIKTDFPKELSEVMMLLSNIWLNPLVISASFEEMEKRLLFFNSILKNLGLDLLDEDLMNLYIGFYKLITDNR